MEKHNVKSIGTISENCKPAVCFCIVLSTARITIKIMQCKLSISQLILDIWGEPAEIFRKQKHCFSYQVNKLSILLDFPSSFPASEKEDGEHQNQIGHDLGISPRRINEIIHGKRSITADMAHRLSTYFCNSGLCFRWYRLGIPTGSIWCFLPFLKSLSSTMREPNWYFLAVL